MGNPSAATRCYQNFICGRRLQHPLERLQPLCHPGTRLVLNLYSRLWEQPLGAAQRLGLSRPLLPQNWLTTGVSANVVGATALVLGPEPLIGPQRVILNLEAQHLTLATDGLGPFVVSNE